MHPQQLSEFAKVLVINYFDTEGVLIASTHKEYIGVPLPKDDPVWLFYLSGEDRIHEDIRNITDSKDRLKKAYAITNLRI